MGVDPVHPQRTKGCRFPLETIGWPAPPGELAYSLTVHAEEACTVGLALRNRGLLSAVHPTHTRGLKIQQSMNSSAQATGSLRRITLVCVPMATGTPLSRAQLHPESDPTPLSSGDIRKHGFRVKEIHAEARSGTSGGYSEPSAWAGSGWRAPLPRASPAHATPDLTNGCRIPFLPLKPAPPTSLWPEHTSVPSSHS